MHYDLWTGPAAERPFNENRFHYNWHWNWEYGGGEAANNGVHMLDCRDPRARQANASFPRTSPAKGAGSPGTIRAKRRTPKPPASATTTARLSSWKRAICRRTTKSGFSIGVTFYGSKGYLALKHGGPFETVVDGTARARKAPAAGAHAELLANFYAAVRSRQADDLLAPLEYGRTAAGLCHLANISYRLGRSVEFDPASETFPGDAEAAALLTRAAYRPGFVVPDKALTDVQAAREPGRRQSRKTSVANVAESYDAVLVVSFGGPEGPDDVLPFLENVLRGKNVPRERMLAVAEHYEHFGGRSPTQRPESGTDRGARGGTGRQRSAAAGLLGQSQLASAAARHAGRNGPRRHSPGAGPFHHRLQLLFQLPAISGKHRRRPSSRSARRLPKFTSCGRSSIIPVSSPPRSIVCARPGSKSRSAAARPHYWSSRPTAFRTRWPTAATMPPNCAKRAD